MSIILSLVLLMLVVSSCASQTKKLLNLPEVKEQPLVEQPQAEEKPLEELLQSDPGEYVMGVSDSATVGDKKLKVLSIKREFGVKVDVNGQQGSILSTKDFEVINGLKVETLKFDFSDLDKPKATIKVDEFTLGPNEYILLFGTPVTVGNQRVRVQEVGDDYVFVEVGPNAAQKVLLNTEKSVEGLSFKLLKTFYKDTERQPHAWLKITP